MGLTILFLVISLVLSAVFSGIEIAFVSANRLKIELDRKNGVRSAQILARLIENPSRFISMLLVGNNIALVVFGSLMTIFLRNEFGIDADVSLLGLLWVTLITTAVVLVFGEFLPKAIFRVSADWILGFFALPIKYLIYYPLRPIASVFMGISKSLIKLILRSDYAEPTHELSAVDLEYFIKETNETHSASNDDDDSESEDELNTDIFEKALYLRDVKVRECMVPRTETVGIDADATLDELKERLVESKHSKIIVYEDSIDKVIGYTHHYELLNNPQTIRDIVFPITVVPETMSANDLLRILTKQRKSIAHVVDEYGGTAGIVTLEDVIEEIFGEIQDEHDKEQYLERRIAEDEYTFSGRLEVDYINEKYELGIPVGDYETLAGYIVTQAEDIPEVGEELEMDQFLIRILSAADNRINSVNMRVVPKKDDEE